MTKDNACFYESSNLSKAQVTNLTQYAKAMGIEYNLTHDEALDQWYMSTESALSPAEVHSLITAEDHIIGPPFKWRTKTGVFRQVTDMETTHLFWVLRMIWNHTVPHMYRLTPYQEDIFGPQYTSDYMAKAVQAMMLELAKRNNLPDWLQAQLDLMCTHARQMMSTTLEG